MSEEQTQQCTKPRGRLSLRRKSGQTIVIPAIDTTITFIMHGKQVQLIVEAPKEVVIKRGELLEESA